MTLKTHSKYFSTLICVLILTIAGSGILYSQQPYSQPSTIATPFYVQYARVDGGLFQAEPVFTYSTTTTLSAIQSGSLINTLGSAAFTFTLPAPTGSTAGLVYDFIIPTTIASGGNMKIVTDAATTYLLGPILVTSNGGTSASYVCNGTSHIAISMNGTTTGGAAGSRLRFQAINATQWAVSGNLAGGVSSATPCSTS